MHRNAKNHALHFNKDYILWPKMFNIFKKYQLKIKGIFKKITEKFYLEKDTKCPVHNNY